MGRRVSDERFAETKHQYTDPRTGERVTGVTAVVGCFDSGDKLGRGAMAAAKLERQGINHRAEWDGKRDTGTRVHGYARLWMEGRTAEIPDEDAPYMEAFRRFCNDEEPEWVCTETPVVSSLGYGGRFDWLGFLPRVDAFVLGDIKTGKAYPVELTLQLVGYRRCDGVIRYNDEGWATHLDPMPHVDLCAGLYLHSDGTYNLKYVDADDAAFDAFKSLLVVKTWARATDKIHRQLEKEQAA